MPGDDEQGRPPRHERPATRGELVKLGERGAGEMVEVKGRAACVCGREVVVEVRAPEGSMAVSIARAQLAPPVKCEGCMDREDRERQAVEEQRERLATIARRVDSLRLPPAWRGVTFDRLEGFPEQKRACEAAQRWVRGEVGGVVLHGLTGRGKTLLAVAAAIERCAVSAVRWLRVAELLMDLRMPFDSPEYARACRALDPGQRGAALVLDDLDKSKPSEHALQPLYVAINAWVENRQPLFVTLNRSLDELASWMGTTFGDPVASRLASHCEVVEVSGPDRRLS